MIMDNNEDNNDGSCPHCKKGKMLQASAICDTNIPNTGDRIELICDLCAHCIVKVYHNDTIKRIDDYQCWLQIINDHLS